MNTTSPGGPTFSLHAPSSLSAPLIERAPLPMVEVEGPQYRICFVNPAFCRLVGVDRESLLGHPFAEIVSNAATCVPILDRVYQTGGSETQMVPDSAEPDAACWLVAMWPALGAEGPVRVIITLTRSAPFRQDMVAVNEALLLGALRQHELREISETATARLHAEIADRIHAEQRLRQAQIELRAKADTLESTVLERTAELRASIGHLEAFSYSLVHDLRAPVRAIHGFTQMVLEMPRSEVAPAAAELLRRVITASTRMDSLIQDVLSLSQVVSQPIKTGPVDVDTLVRALISERPEMSPPRAHVQVVGPLLGMHGHEAYLSQCLTNLLTNAVKFVPPGQVPELRIWSELRPAPAPPAPGENPPPASPVVRLWVDDQGIGIAPENQKKIFEIFQRLHHASQYEGSGIGLAIVSKAMLRMHGRVGVEPGHPRGSRFWLELPPA